MTYSTYLSSRARHAALVAVITELDRQRARRARQEEDLSSGRSLSPVELQATDDAITDLQEALDALNAAVRSDGDVMPQATVERVVSAAREANEQRGAAMSTGWQRAGAMAAVMLSAAGVTRRAMADELGISTSALGRRLRGEVPMNIRDLDGIARVVAHAVDKRVTPLSIVRAAGL